MEEIYLIYLFVLLTGACIGSFLNVVALRAISKESIVFPPSKCPQCGNPIKWYDNIPVLSYLFTFKGKCRNCGGKVSVQYPIVEFLTALLFLFIFIMFGVSVQTLLLLILICVSIVITITDIKEGTVFDIHSWILIIFSIIYSLWINGLENYSIPAIGLISGVIVMEFIAKLSYYLIRKHNDNETPESLNEEGNDETESTNTQDMDINEYIKKNKRAFGEGDTYLAAAAGALLGWKYLIISLALSIIIQALCILPQFLKNLYDKKEYKLLISLSSFVILAGIYWILSNIFTLNLFVIFGFIIALIFFAIDSIQRLKNTVNEEGFTAIPFGPALLLSSFIMLFFGKYIIGFLKHYIFMII